MKAEGSGVNLNSFLTCAVGSRPGRIAFKKVPSLSVTYEAGGDARDGLSL
jgi:hypothetical protein